MKKSIQGKSAGAQHLSIAIVWQRGPGSGTFAVARGTLGRAALAAGKGRVSGSSFNLDAATSARVELTVRDAMIDRGAFATRIAVQAKERAFAFFLRDVRAECPIFIPEYGVAVTAAGDRRNYDEIAAAVRSKHLVSAMQRYETEPEETYEVATRRNRNLMCPTWLGLGRDMRFFEVGYDPRLGYWGYIQPRYHSTLQNIPESKDQPYSIAFSIGPGASCRSRIERRLEDGVLPILRSAQHEDDVDYHVTSFCTLETQPLGDRNVRGSEWKACYPNTGGNMLQEADRAALKDILQAEMRQQAEETVCVFRVEAVNRGRVPRYAWLSAAIFQPTARGWHDPKPETYDASAGFTVLGTGRILAVNLLNGRPMPQEEVAVLLQPGETATLDLIVPHQPISRERAARLARLDVVEHLDASRKFWRRKLAAGARIRVPEAAIDERIRAGLLHCDVAALGREPNGPVLATIGWYSPIGSESSPIIQFFDSMGWHQLAERSIDFFLARQRPDGFIQNFGGYQLETGPTLWTMGEHYRYTRDDAWVRRVKPSILKACEYILNWRNRNKKPELRGRGYGLMDGKVADPEDYFHSFMLNGLSYVGIQRASEMLAAIDLRESRRLAKEAAEFRKDIRAAFLESMARSPVVPLGDGTWAPSAPPWADYTGPLCLYGEGGKWQTHAAFGARDSLVGAMYLPISEVLDPREPAATFLLRFHQELMTVENAAFTQPYYVRHDYMHIKRGEVKPFLKTYYNQFTALQDRQTYTFWEHYHHASQHKTHEEGWFLMQTRWMLWIEEGDTLRLLNGIPRAWLKDGQKIELDRVVSYFGPVSLSVESQAGRNRIAAQVTCNTGRKPREILLRLPHPEGRKAVKVEGGRYDPRSETVCIQPFKGTARVTAHF